MVINLLKKLVSPWLHLLFPLNCMVTMSSEETLEPKEVKEVEYCKVSLLDLPQSILECILERFSPTELCRLAEVCSSLRDTCRSDRLWQKHIKRKWGNVIGDVAYQEWQWHVATKKRENTLNQYVQNGSLGTFTGVWPTLNIGSFLENCQLPGNWLSDYSMMAWYISLEKGKFWFPAKVYTSDGVMLYFYDALLSYDSRTDMFKARYRSSGWQLIEEEIQWKNLRPAPGQNSQVCHVSNCLNDLKPEDHIMVQWKDSEDHSYDWWHAVTGHLDSCEENNHCQCHCSDTLIIEFRQYPPESPYRRIVLSRRNCGDQAIAGGGIYGRIRKLSSVETEWWREKWGNSS